MAGHPKHSPFDHRGRRKGRPSRKPGNASVRRTRPFPGEARWGGDGWALRRLHFCHVKGVHTKSIADA